MILRFSQFLIVVMLPFGAAADEFDIKLRSIDVKSSVSVSAKKIFSYRYSISNPMENKGRISSVRIFISQDNRAGIDQTARSLAHCARYLKSSHEFVEKTRPTTPIGSASPANWICSYAKLAGFNEGAYGWIAAGEDNQIAPGQNQSGFTLTSTGLPTIRELVIEPAVDLDSLPKDYEENVGKTVELRNSIRWMGKTVGPILPDPVFSKDGFLRYLDKLKDDSITLGWISGVNIEKEFKMEFAKARSKLATCSQDELRVALESIISVAKKYEGKGVSPEGYALIAHNAAYFLEQAPLLSDSQRKACSK